MILFGLIYLILLLKFNTIENILYRNNFIVILVENFLTEKNRLPELYVPEVSHNNDVLLERLHCS